MNETASTRRFIREALPLLSSYFYSEPVLLEPTEVEAGEQASEEYERFARLLRLRHAIACAMKLKPILTAIERGVSRASEVVRFESKGALFGRLDVPLYLTRRSNNLSWPRTFPVLLAKDTPNTPENQLMTDTLRQLVQRLGTAQGIATSAERCSSLNLLRWCREKLRSDTWARAIPTRHPERLKREAEHRLRKRQTGNEAAYSNFLDWFRHWQFDPSHVDTETDDDFISLLLAFPPGDFFEDRVFEIWCLHQVIESFRRCGAITIEGPRPLTLRGTRPICEMTYEGYPVEIWFQRALPSAMARWNYVHSGQALGAIPDITIIGDRGKRLLIDAKRREVRTKTRSEESYKMLGYLENFRELFEPNPFYGALCFLSPDDLFTEVKTTGGHKLVLIGAHPYDPGICAMGGRMDTIIAEWLANATS